MELPHLTLSIGAPLFHSAYMEALKCILDIFLDSLVRPSCSLPGTIFLIVFAAPGTLNFGSNFGLAVVFGRIHRSLIFHNFLEIAD